MSEACVALDGVGKRFGDAWALDDVSVRCPLGQTTAIVGESGSGKTEFIEHVELYVNQRKWQFDKTLLLNMRTCTTPNSV